MSESTACERTRCAPRADGDKLHAGKERDAVTVDPYGAWLKTEKRDAADSLERLVSGS